MSPQTDDEKTLNILETLKTDEPYVQGANGFQWAEPDSMLHIDHIGDGVCAAGPGQRP